MNSKPMDSNPEGAEEGRSVNCTRKPFKRKVSTQNEETKQRRRPKRSASEMHNGEVFDPSDPLSRQRLKGHLICMWKHEDGQRCMKVFYGNHSLCRHNRVEHWERSYYCTNCNFVLKTIWQFYYHFKISATCDRDTHGKVTDGKQHSYQKRSILVDNYVLPIKVTSTLSTAELVSGGNRTTSVKGVVERQSVLPSTSTSDAVQHFSARSLTPTGEVGLERQPNNPRHSSTATEEIEANGSAGIGAPSGDVVLGNKPKTVLLNEAQEKLKKMEHDANKLEEENKLLRRALKADDLEIEMTVLKKAHEELKDEFKKAQKVFSDELDHVRIEKQGFASKIFCLETRNQEMETLLTDKENEMKKLKEELDEKTAKLEKATSVIKNKFGLAFYYWKEKKDLELKLKNLKEVAELEAREKHLEQYTQSDCVSSTPESQDLGSGV